jgi:hypothetical protein
MTLDRWQINACNNDTFCEPCLQPLTGTFFGQCNAPEAIESTLRGQLSRYCSTNPKVLDGSIKCIAQYYASECKSGAVPQLAISAAVLAVLTLSFCLWL